MGSFIIFIQGQSTMFRLLRHKTGVQLLKKSLLTYESCTKNVAKETTINPEKLANSLGSGGLAGAPESGIRMLTLEERASRIQQGREIDIPVISALGRTLSKSK